MQKINDETILSRKLLVTFRRHSTVAAVEVVMRKFLKHAAVFLTATTLIGAISASEASEAKRDPSKTHLLDTRAMVVDDFSGLELKPIVEAILTWTGETQGDISIMPPTDADGLFYDIAVNGTGNDMNVFNMDLTADATNPDPWQQGCRHAFYIIRVTSNNSTVKALDGEDRQIMAFTFTGCTFKFIAVVADRMRDEHMLYTTMLHELGHMWGLKDNKAGKESIMNGSWPGSSCITKKDLHDVYGVMGKKGMEPKDTGCAPK